MPLSKRQILEAFAELTGGTGGIDNWLSEDAPDLVFERLGRLEEEPLTRVQLNQLLLLCHEAGVAEAFYRYYWLEAPKGHPYDVTKVDGFAAEYLSSEAILSIEHLRWGLRRLYIDGLLFYGNIRTAYRHLRNPFLSVTAQFHGSGFPTERMVSRGAALPLRELPKDDRYLVSEMACKSYDMDELGGSDLKTALLEAWRRHQSAGARKATIRDLLADDLRPSAFRGRQTELVFSADDILDQEVVSEADVAEHYQRVADKFSAARAAALENTKLYLSMVNELDVYVATSMRSRQDFRDMADTCDYIFGSQILARLNLRYFDPTLSAAEGHEDKGLIECLMVKSAKVLLYIAGQRDSYGKDAEAAMALSLGKPVIFLCDEESRRNFYRDVHPLARLINFKTGVAVGAMVTSNRDHVVELLRRVFENDMAYELEQPRPGYFRLREQLTGSVVRLQTSDRLLRETFWNYYHGEDGRGQAI